MRITAFTVQSGREYTRSYHIVNRLTSQLNPRANDAYYEVSRSSSPAGLPVEPGWLNARAKPRLFARLLARPAIAFGPVFWPGGGEITGRRQGYFDPLAKMESPFGVDRYLSSVGGSISPSALLMIVWR